MIICPWLNKNVKLRNLYNIIKIRELQMTNQRNNLCGGHSISINASRVWGARVGVQVSRRKIHTHIHLDYARIKILSCIYIKKKKKYTLQNFISPMIVEGE